MDYYNVVRAVYLPSKMVIQRRKGWYIRADTHLLCGEFKTEEEAREYINIHDCAQYDDIVFDDIKLEIKNEKITNSFICTEIELCMENGNILEVTHIDRCDWPQM